MADPHRPEGRSCDEPSQPPSWGHGAAFGWARVAGIVKRVQDRTVNERLGTATVAHHHTEREIFDFITSDFQCTWDAIAEKPTSVAGNRGNFMFALQAAILLEWVGQLCASDPTRKALRDFATELQKIEPKYFTELDDKCRAPSTFTLPGVGPDPLKSLLGAVWDLIRNGQAHQYHDIIVKLTDGKQWVLGLQGVWREWPLSKVAASRSSLQHLAYRIDSDGDLMLIVHPGAFFLDICGAVQSAHLLSRGLTINHFTRGGPGKQSYQYDLPQLERALKRGAHA